MRLPFENGSRPTGAWLSTLPAATRPPEAAAPEKIAAENVRVLTQPERDNGDVVRQKRFTRYVSSLTDADVLALHRIVARRAELIYRPIYRSNWEIGMSLDKRRATP